MTDLPSDYTALEDLCYAKAIERLDALVNASGNPGNVHRVRAVDVRGALAHVLPYPDAIDVTWFIGLLQSNPAIFDGGNDRARDLRDSAYVAIEGTVWAGIEDRLEAEIARRAALVEEPSVNAPGM